MAVIARFKEFIEVEGAAGILLFIAALLALLLSNSPLAAAYHHLFAVPVSVHFGTFGLEKPLILWVNDGLMAIFFFLVGLEIKREVLAGHLNSLSSAALPLFGAVGGMVVPAGIYLWFNWTHPEAVRGWAIPTATDIAFALGILALLGSRVSTSLKVFLTALAIFDDLGAIIIIALFYTLHISLVSLGLAGICLLALVLLNRFNVQVFWPYGMVGLVLWVCVLKSGVHATLAGVCLAMAIPMVDPNHIDSSLLRRVEHSLHPWVAYCVLPIFAFANAGISFAGVDKAGLLSPVTLGILLGLFVGKQIGVFGCTWLAIKLKWAPAPEGSSWRGFYGVALLCGVGFTMSLFIGTLAFDEMGLNYEVWVRVGVLVGSLLSGVFGYLLLRTAPLQDHA